MANAADDDDNQNEGQPNAAGSGAPDPAASGNTTPAAPAPDAGTGGKDGDDGQSSELTLAPDPNEDADVLVTEQIRNEVRDALELADFIVKTGARGTNGRSVPPEVIKILKVTAGKVRLFDPPQDPVTIKA